MKPTVNIRKSILVVDDDPSTRELLHRVLTLDGHDVELAADGEEALKILRKEMNRHFDLVIMDLMMPGSGGYSVISKMQDPQYQNVPVVVSSCKILDQEAIDMINREPNVLDIIPKPIDIAEFRMKIRILLFND